MSVISLFVSLLFLLLPFAIIGVIFKFLSKKNKDRKDSFAHSIRLFYLYAVIGTTLFLSIGGVIFTWTNAVNLILPDKPPTHVVKQELYAQNQRNKAVRGLFTSMSSIGIGVPVFLCHKRKVKEK